MADLYQLLHELIRKEIQRGQGIIDFARFMELALYAPGLGYYDTATQKFGKTGDFTTAPELSPLFGRCLAGSARDILDSVPVRCILEFGAGTGKLAATLIQELDRLSSLPDEYLILEISSDLRSRQQAYLSLAVPDYYARIKWITNLPEPGFTGLVIANEVLDAMPVHRFELSADGILELCVSFENERFVWRTHTLRNEQLSAALSDILSSLAMDLPTPYRSEVNLLIAPWIASISDFLQQGALLCIDYGYARADFYHPQRTDGTLLCHYQHRAHADPLILVGQQDISASVDFTALATAAVACRLDVAGYTTLANYLLANGLGELIEASLATEETSRRAILQAAKVFLLPGEMGERFKAMLMTRNLSGKEVAGHWNDQRHLL